MPRNTAPQTSSAGSRRRSLTTLVVGTGFVALVAALVWWAWPRAQWTDTGEARLRTSDAELEAYCEEAIGPPRVERYGEHVFVAIGHDLANVILVRTAEGGVLVDAGMSPDRARRIRAALLEASPGPIRHVVITHSHIDHIGGLSVWIDEEEQAPEVWATDALPGHLFKQYGMFRTAESARGARQFGYMTSGHGASCSGLGALIDLDAAMEVGIRMPTRTFSGEASFTVGGLTFVLHEAHGETHDQLFVHVPELDAVFPGDNWYRTFPNLYTIRGTSPRPVDEWIESLDRMRALDPALLLPSHTVPVEGREAVREALTTYRDGIQWVRDQTVRRANAGESVDAIAATVGLPDELRSVPALREFYCQIDWSVRGIYGSQLGWFDGRPEALYPVAPDEVASRSVALMGGQDAVLAEVDAALDADDPRWALHLVALARAAAPSPDGAIDERYVRALRAVAATTQNTNGRSYLLEFAWEVEHAGRRGLAAGPAPSLDDAMVAAIPLDVIFSVMQTRLIPERAGGVHETVLFEIDEHGTQRPVYLTVRNRVAEVRRGAPLPDTPTPVATVRTSGETWRRIALGEATPAGALTRGELRVNGDPAALIRFMDRFERGL